MARKKIKLEEKAIREILVADTDLESGVEDRFEKEDEEQQQQKQQQASAEVEPQAATSGRLPALGLPQERNTNIHPFVGPAKVVKKSEAPHINKDKMPLSEFMLFFTEIVHLLVEQINVQGLDKK